MGQQKTPGQVVAEIRGRIFGDVPRWKKMSKKQRSQHEEFAQEVAAALGKGTAEEQGYVRDIEKHGIGKANRRATK